MADQKNRPPTPTNKLSLDLLAPDLDAGVAPRFKEQWQAPMDFEEAKLSPFGEKEDFGEASPQDDILGRRLGGKDRQAVDAPK